MSVESIGLISFETIYGEGNASMRLLNVTNSKISFVILASVGLIGLFGQAMLLHNLLVNSYPYKMMGTPPAEFYSSVGGWGYYISVGAGILGIVWSLKFPRWLTTVVPVVLCPLFYWLTFEGAHIIQGFTRNQLITRNFDGYTGMTARYEFGFEVLSLIFIGAIIAAATGLIVTNLIGLRSDKLA